MTDNQRLRAEVDALKCRVKELEFANKNHLAALKAAVEKERAEWNKWADAVIRDLEMRARLHNDDTIEISQGRLVELDTLRARGAAHD